MKVNSIFTISLAVSILLLPTRNLAAFETHTHALITLEAFQRSVLNPENPDAVLKRLGLDRLHPSHPFQTFWTPDPISLYYKSGGMDGSQPLQDYTGPAEFERCQMAQFTSIENIDIAERRLYIINLFNSSASYENLYSPLPISNWLVRGAIREDDMGSGWLGWAGTRGGENCAPEWWATMSDQPGGIMRPFNHFYDPVHSIGLTTTIGGVYSVHGLRSIDWALGYQDSFATPAVPARGGDRNTYSYTDARNAFWRALTHRRDGSSLVAETVDGRYLEAMDAMALWATTFRSLGDVVHLLEDTGQPQHTRNDPHSPANTSQQQAFEGYTNARILGGDGVGDFVRGFYASLGPQDLTVPPLGSYGAENRVMFATPLRFFTTPSDLQGAGVPIQARAGLADYSNRGFFTGGTLPGMESDYPHAWPPTDFSDPANGYSTSFGSCDVAFSVDPRIRNATCMHYLHDVPDLVDPQYAQTRDELPQGYSPPAVPIATEGVFSRFFRYRSEPYARIPFVSWSPTVVESIGNLTIPRAVGYTAGFIDFFFRGRIELSPPPDGLYAVADQGKPHHVENGLPFDSSGKLFGFEKFRVRVRNATMVDAEGNPTLRDAGSGTIVPQTMRAGIDGNGNPTGKLVAIARYHRNPCYAPDLSGERVRRLDPQTGNPLADQSWVPSGCALADTRTAFQEVSVSAPIHLSGDGDLPGAPVDSVNPCVNVGNVNTGAHDACENEAALVEFDFSNDPVPINATDLFLQVAYRGELGLEQDGIAVGMVDIAEPNFLSMWNGTDWFYLNGDWVTPDQVPELPLGNDRDPAVIDTLFVCYGQQVIGRLTDGQTVAPREFIRLGVIGEAGPSGYGLPTAAGVYAVVGRHGQYVPTVVVAPSRQLPVEDAQWWAAPYAPAPIPWYSRGTPLGMNMAGAFFSYGPETEDRTMKALVLSPAIGSPEPGRPTQLTTGLEVAPDLCMPAS